MHSSIITNAAMRVAEQHKCNASATWPSIGPSIPTIIECRCEVRLDNGAAAVVATRIANYPLHLVDAVGDVLQ
jgi:hypothetical protein